MNENRLKLNPDKTEFIVFGSEVQRSKLSQHFPVQILGNDIVPVNKVRTLGVIFDSSFRFSAHVSSVSYMYFSGVRDALHVFHMLLYCICDRQSLSIEYLEQSVKPDKVA